MALRNFANLTFSESDRRLTGPHDSVSLRPKIAAVLEILLNNKKAVINKEVFFKNCWPETHVEERALAQVFSELRQAFERVGGDRNLIESIAKKGYRLNVEPNKKDALHTELVHKPQLHEVKRRSGHRKLVYWAIPFFLIVLLVIFSREDRTPKPWTSSSIAFLPFKNAGSDSSWNWLELALPDLLSQTTSETMDVIPFQEVFKELNRLDCEPSEAFAHQTLSKSLGKPVFIFASFSTEQKKVTFHFKITGKEKAFQISTENPAQSVQAISKRICKELGQVVIDMPFSVEFLNVNYGKGLNYFLNDEHEKALPFLEVCFGEEPSHPSVGIMLTKCYILKNQFNQAEHLLNSSSGWDTAEVSMLRAELAFQTRNFPKSIQHIKEVIAEPKANELLKARAYSLLGTTLVRTGASSQGFEAYQNAERIYLEKKHFKGYVAVTLNRLRSEQFSGIEVSEAAWQGLIEKCQIVENRFIEAHAHYGLGDTYYFRSEFKKAIQRFEFSLTIRQALADERGIGACHAALGSCLLMIHEFDKAEEHLHKALEINLKNQDSYNAINQYLEIAKVNIAQKKLEMAFEQYENVHQLALDYEDNEGVYRAIYGKIQISLMNGENQIATKKIDEISSLELSPRNKADLKMLQASLAYLQKNAGKALLLCTQAKDLIPPTDWNPIKEAYLFCFQQAVLNGDYQPLPYEINPLHTPDF